MSKHTMELVEEALSAHIADENGGALLTQWIIVAQAVSSDNPNTTFYQYMNHDGNPHEWLGLLHMGVRKYDNLISFGEETIE